MQETQSGETTLPAGPAESPAVARGLASLVGFLVCAELASGVIQGYYTPILADIADHLSVNAAELNWFEAAQLIFSALIVPPLARLGDLVGHRRVLLAATVITALASWGIAVAPNFATMLAAWTVQGAYVVWLPLEVAIIHRRAAASASGRRAALTSRSAAVLVGALELAIIVAVLAAGRLVDHVSMTTLLALPAVAVTLCLPLIWYGVEKTQVLEQGTFDWPGLTWLVATVGLVMVGLIVIRLDGLDSLVAWGLILLGLAAVRPWWRTESRSTSPLIDVEVLARPEQWRVQLVAFLLGMSILGAQVPLSIFGRIDPATAGYGLGLSAGAVASRIAIYVLCLAIGALMLPLTIKGFGARGAPIACCLAMAGGYALWFVNHDDPLVTLLWLAVTGLGAGGLVPWVPASAAAAAPPERVGVATGLSNASKTMGGGFAAALFAICLATTGSLELTDGHAPVSGYYAVWAICAGSALAAGMVLLSGLRRGGGVVGPPVREDLEADAVRSDS